jgi:hypothetical protein
MNIAFTISEFAKEIGCDRHHLATRVSALGIKPHAKVKTGKAAGTATYHIRDLVRASGPDEHDSERLRKLAAEVERLEIQNTRARGETVSLADLMKFLPRFKARVEAKILSLPLSDAEKDSLLAEMLGFDDPKRWQAAAAH